MFIAMSSKVRSNSVFSESCKTLSEVDLDLLKSLANQVTETLEGAE